LRSQTRFRRYRGRRVPFSCFARPTSFSAVPRASGPVCLFWAPRIIFGGTEGIGSRFHVLRARNRFRRYRRRRVSFSCFASPVSFSAGPRASGRIFMFCAPVLIFSGSEGVGSRFQVLRSRTHFQRYQGRPIPFSTTGHVFGGTEVVGALFQVSYSRTRIRRYRGRRVPSSCFARPDLFSAV
jgi:hypothetical protein